MAIVVEDGTGKEDANSFVSRAELIAFAASRGVTIPDADSADVHIINSSDYLLTLCFDGEVKFSGQGMPFPRVSRDASGELKYADNVVPENVKKAQLALAVASFNGISLLQDSAAGSLAVKRRKTGPLEKEYFSAKESGSYASGPKLPFASSMLAPFVCGQGAPFRIVRA